MGDNADDLVSMKRQRGAGSRPTAITEPDGDEYGYGLTIRLENHELDALKLAMPQPGREFKITATAVVTNVTESKSKGNEGDRCVTLQITALKLR